MKHLICDCLSRCDGIGSLHGHHDELCPFGYKLRPKKPERSRQVLSWILPLLIGLVIAIVGVLLIPCLDVGVGSVNLGG
jgi:hypothetical protein